MGFSVGMVIGIGVTEGGGYDDLCGVVLHGGGGVGEIVGRRYLDFLGGVRGFDHKGCLFCLRLFRRGCNLRQQTLGVSPSVV